MHLNYLGNSWLCSFVMDLKSKIFIFEVERSPARNLVESMGMVILSVSDTIDKSLYNENVGKRFNSVDIVLGCGDLPYYYLEFLSDAINASVLFVHGNHDPTKEYSEEGSCSEPAGAINMHRRVIKQNGIIIVGFEGSLRYRSGIYQYTQAQMWSMVISILPKLMFNRIFHHRWLDILMTHSPPWGVNDQRDRAHQGFKAIRWLIGVCKPAFHFHGHVRSGGRKKAETIFGQTRVINTHGYRLTEVDQKEILKQGTKVIRSDK